MPVILRDVRQEPGKGIPMDRTDIPLLARLSTKRLETLVVIAVRGLQYEAAAAVLNCEFGTVKSRVSRARAQLQKWLAEEDRARPSPAAIAHWKRKGFAIRRLGQDEPVNPGIEDELALLYSIMVGECAEKLSAPVLAALTSVNPRSDD